MIALNRDHGFTIVEILVAVLLLEIGLAGLVAGGALLTRLLTAGRRAERVAAFAAARLERLHIDACITGAADGTEELRQGGVLVATNRWAVMPANGGGHTMHILLTSRAEIPPGTHRGTQIESAVVC